MAASTAPEYQEDNLYEIPLAQLHPDPNQPRKHFCPQALEELAETIRSHGVLQPILFTCRDNKLIIISGERRFRAAQQVGLSSIPAIFKENPSLELAIIENIIRENLSPIEEAEAIQRLLDEKICRQKDLPHKLGKAKSTISEILSLQKLPDEIKDDCRSNNRVPRGILVEIARKRKPETMLALYHKYKERGLTRGEIRKVSRSVRPKAPGQAVQKAITELSRKIDQLYELGFENDEEKDQIEAQFVRLKKQLERCLRKNNSAQQDGVTLELDF